MVVKMPLPGVGKRMTGLSVALGRGTVRKARFLTGASRKAFLEAWRAQVKIDGHRVCLKWVYVGIFVVLTVASVVGLVEVFHASLALLVEWGFHQMLGAVEKD